MKTIKQPTLNDIRISSDMDGDVRIRTVDDNIWIEKDNRQLVADYIYPKNAERIKELEIEIKRIKKKYYIQTN